MTLYKAQMWDKMQYLFRKYYDRMIHSAFYFDGQIDLDVLYKTYDYMVERIPVFHSSYHNNFIKPYWSEHKNLHAEDYVRVVEVSSPDQVENAVEDFLTGEIGIHDKYQLRVAVIRCQGKDVLCQLQNHMCMDGGDTKVFWTLFYQVYNEISAGKPIDVVVKNGDRSHFQVYTNFNEEDKKKAMNLYKNISAVKGKTKFPFAGGTSVRKRILHEKIAKETFIALHQKGKEQGYSVNDLILTAYVRSLYTVCNADKNGILSVPCMVDLRRHIQGGASYGFSNHVGFMICNTGRCGEKFEDTLRLVAEQTNAAKKDKFLGLYSLPLLNLAYTLFPQFIAEIAIQIGYTNPYLGMSNVGVVSEKDFHIDGLTTENIWMTGGIKSTPYMQLSFTCFQKELTFTIAEKCSEKDGEKLSYLLTLIKRELLGYLSE